MEIISDPMQMAAQKSVDSGKEPVIWSGFDDAYHFIMDSVYTTISNTSVGGINFIEAVYADWYGRSTPYSSSKLWSSLSAAYANSCTKVINPATGEVYSSIKFLYPVGKNVTNMFGELFKSSELPTIVANGTIKTITLAATDPNTMKITKTIDVDITELIDYYQKMSLSGSSSSTFDDIALGEKIFEMFYEKVKEVM